MTIKISALLALLVSLFGTPAENQELTMRAMECYQLNYETDVVYCIDSEGFVWSFYGCEDYSEGDIIAALMSNNGTPFIFDDVILYTNYSGYSINRAEALSNGTVTLNY